MKHIPSRKKRGQRLREDKFTSSGKEKGRAFRTLQKEKINREDNLLALTNWVRLRNKKKRRENGTRD